MILDENEILEQQNAEEQKYLKLLRTWGFSILFGGITTVMVAFCLVLKLILKSTPDRLVIILLIPFFIMAFAAIRSGVAFIYTPIQHNNQNIGIRWLKIFWLSFIIMLFALAFNA